jgi:hypothetical protein
MRSHWWWIGWSALGLALLPTSGQAAAPPEGDKGDPAAAWAVRIDKHLEAKFKIAKARPAPAADDAEFVRRVYLDLGGRIPKVSEVRAFLRNKRLNKRRILVDRLLASSNYVNHFTNVWRTLLLPNNNNQQVQFLGPQLENWVRTRLRENVSYDKMVRDLIITPVAQNQRVMRGQPGFDQNAAAFFQANELKSDNLAAATSRIFLGVKLECAQCHNHPFAQWTRKQFWEYTAFFAGIKPQQVDGGVFSPATDDQSIRDILIPGTEKKLAARFLDGGKPEWEEGVGTRAILAKWMTAADNPFFAKAAVNRSWEHFFGIGLVDPVDDARDENPPSHPELLEDLAKAFADQKFDMKFLIRAITSTKAYQRSSTMTHKSQEDPRIFARMSLKGLSPEQIFDSLAVATGYRGNNPMIGQGFGFNNNSPRAEFLAKFANPVDRRTEPQTSILQALALMNGQFITEATSLDRSETLAGVVDAPFMDYPDKLNALYLAALGRPMRPSEESRLVPYVKSGGPSRKSDKALADVFWVLLNSSEFILNH